MINILPDCSSATGKWVPPKLLLLLENLAFLLAIPLPTLSVLWSYKKNPMVVFKIRWNRPLKEKVCMLIVLYYCFTVSSTENYSNMCCSLTITLPKYALINVASTNISTKLALGIKICLCGYMCELFEHTRS